MFDRKKKAGDIDIKMTQANAEKMWEGVLEGLNIDPEKVKYGSAQQRLLINLRYNVHVTAAFKNHHNTLELVRNLFDDDGNLKEFNQFYKDVKPIMGDYNKTWLEAEFVTARSSARMAGRWMSIKERGGKATFMTQRDGRVSDEHRALDGITLPVTHSFWKTHIPPLRWRCRCYIRWAGHDAEDVHPTELPEVPDMFKNNPVDSGKVFNEHTPYFLVEDQFRKKAGKNFGYKPPVDPAKFEKNVLTFNELYENENYTLEAVNNMVGGFVFRHIRSDKKELSHILPVARKMADNGDSVIINEVVKTRKNADITLNGIYAEIKVNNTPTLNAIDNALRSAKSQAGIVILNIESDISAKDLEKAIYNRVQRTDKINEVRVFYKDNLYTLTREEILNRTFYGKIK